MDTIGRNDPCPCGSGKKYKKCCQLKEEVVNLETFRYEKFLKVRSSSTDKMMKIAHEIVGVNPMDVITFLNDSPLFENRNTDPLSYSEDQALFFQYILNILILYIYPVGNHRELLWKYCLNEYKNKFDNAEILFLESLENFIAGFFQIKDTDNAGFFITAEDIITLKTYKIMDKGLCAGTVKNDVLCGLLVPYSEYIWILEGGAPMVIPPMEKEYVKESTEMLYDFSKKKLLGRKNEKLSKFLNLYPINLYRALLDYYYVLMETPPTK